MALLPSCCSHQQWENVASYHDGSWFCYWVSQLSQVYVVFISRNPPWCFRFHSLSDFLPWILFFFVFPLLPTSLSLVRATSVTLIKFAPLTCASSVMLNQRQCNGASNSRSYTLLQCQYVSTVQLLCQNVWSHNTDALHNAVDVWWKAKKESPRSLTHIVVILCR